MKKLLNFRLTLFIALSLALGIVVAYFYMQSNLVWSIFFFSTFIICLTLFLTIFSVKGSRIRNIIFSIIFLLFFTFGAIGYSSSINRFDKANLYGRNYDVSAKVVDVKFDNSITKLVLDDAFIEGNRVGKLHYKISLTVYGENNIEIGNVISFNANLYDNNYIFEDRFNANDIERGIKYNASISADKITVIANKPTIFESINLFLKYSLNFGLDKDEFSVGYALLTGNSTYMDYDLISSYRNAGVAHIFAVSGLHIGFLATVLVFLLKRIRINPYIKAGIITIILVFYSGICGFSASSLRATIMTSVSLFAFSKGERYDGLTAISLSAIIILLFSPTQLLCVGFQLSFAVVIGIITLSNSMSKLFKFLPKKIASSIGTVLSAQIFSIPICLYAFGSASLISIIINFIFIPIVSFIFTLTLIGTILGGIFSISNITLFLSNYAFKFINLCMQLFDYKIFMVGGIVLGGGAICYYLCALVLGGFFNLKKLTKIITASVMALMCVGSVILVNVRDYNSVKMYITSSDTLSATFLSFRDEETLIVSDVNYIYSVSKLNRIVQKTNKTHLDRLVIMGGYNADLQVFLTKITSIYSIDNLFYYGEKQEMMENICKVSFPRIKLQNFVDKETLPIPNFNPKFDMNGKILIGTMSDEKTAIFAKLGEENINTQALTENYDIMICLDRADTIFSRCNPKLAISYKYSNIYKNAIKNGNLLLKFS